ncbi:MAG TPA: DUF6766 family protein [Nannocystaceae bacterium]|nr:DUF6766 family protein [Nannocystaceae bacterium]
MRLRDHGLSLALVALTAGCFAGQLLAGHRVDNADRAEHGRPSVSFVEYMASGHSLEATFENWESEFLQMAVFVVLSVRLRQKGSSESKGEGPQEVDEDPRLHRDDPDAPWPVRRGGWVLVLYEHSLSLAFLLIFLATFVGHALGGVRKLAEERAMHGEPPESLLDYVASADFWFESFQNWQSEFLSLFAVVTLSIVLRQRGSPQSKPVAAPHRETGG